MRRTGKRLATLPTLALLPASTAPLTPATVVGVLVEGNAAPFALLQAWPALQRCALAGDPVERPVCRALGHAFLPAMTQEWPLRRAAAAAFGRRAHATPWPRPPALPPAGLLLAVAGQATAELIVLVSSAFPTG